MKGLLEPVVLGALSLILLAAAVLTATVPLGIPHGIAVLLGVAGAAITLVWSMELRHEPALVRFLVALGFTFVAVLIGFTILDNLTR